MRGYTLRADPDEAEGTPADDAEPTEPCGWCGGHGSYPAWTGAMVEHQPCFACGGSGRLEAE
jgi:DnaJ-class molecular chaperone